MVKDKGDSYTVLRACHIGDKLFEVGEDGSAWFNSVLVRSHKRKAQRLC